MDEKDRRRYGYLRYRTKFIFGFIFGCGTFGLLLLTHPRIIFLLMPREWAYGTSPLPFIIYAVVIGVVCGLIFGCYTGGPGRKV